MAHLTDMEELLPTIPSPDIRDYMRESMNCYMAGAYRGSIVLSYIALFDDLLAKLGELSSVNADARTIFGEASRRKADQEVYESYLIDQLTSKNLLSSLDSAFLTTLRTLRNKSAHPSGHKPSPEEARFIFYETITRFLSRPILSTTQLVDELIGRLANSNFFPALINSEIHTIVAEEISRLHHEAFPQLVSKLVAAVASPDPNITKNSSLFLTGLASQENFATNILQAKLITAKADDPQYSNLIMQVLSTNGRLALGLTPTVMGRVRATLSQQIDGLTGALRETDLKHPASVLNSVAKTMSETEFLSNFEPEFEKIIDKRPYSQTIMSLVADRPSLFDFYFHIVLNNTSSSHFQTANFMAESIDTLESGLFHVLSDKQSFQLIVAVLKAAAINAFSAIALRDSKFAGVSILRAKAISYVTSHQVEAGNYLLSEVPSAKPIDEFVSSYLSDETDV